MAFTVKQIKAILSSAGVPTDALDDTAKEICSRHATDLDAIREERDGYKAKAERVDELEEAAQKAGKDPYKVKYEAIKDEYEKYKADITAQQTHHAKETAYRELLKAAGVAEKRIDSIVKISDIDSYEFSDGKFTKADEMTNNIKTEWADFISTPMTEGANVPKPPANNPKAAYTREDIAKMSVEDINKNWKDICTALKSE